MINIKGIDELTKALESAGGVSVIKQIIKTNTADLQTKIQRGVPVQTGFLKRSFIMSIDDGGFTGKVSSNVEYGPYVEYGTFKRSAKPYIRPAINQIEPLFKSDIAKLMGK